MNNTISKKLKLHDDFINSDFDKTKEQIKDIVIGSDYYNTDNFDEEYWDEYFKDIADIMDRYSISKCK